MTNVVNMKAYKSVVVPDEWLFDSNGMPQTPEIITKAITYLHELAGLSDDWFLWIAVHDQGQSVMLDTEKLGWVHTPDDMMQCFFTIKEQLQEMGGGDFVRLCIGSDVKKHEPMPKEFIRLN